MLPLSCQGQALGGTGTPAPPASEVEPAQDPSMEILLALLPLLPEERRGFVADNPSTFLEDLRAVLAQDDSMLWRLVDKRTPLPADYEPDDLVVLGGIPGIVSNRPAASLRISAAEALATMSRAARQGGVVLDVSSAYRSFAYQKGLFARYVSQLGQAQAERESAREGTSQHQLGTAVDFGSITPAYGQTRAYTWLKAHASAYGFSLSYPQGLEYLTGYMYEPWHWRYVGIDTARLLDRWFGGIQQEGLLFLHAAAPVVRAYLP